MLINISAKLFINGDKFKDLSLTILRKILYNYQKKFFFFPDECDINFQGNSDITNEKSNHTIQMFLKYNLRNYTKVAKLLWMKKLSLMKINIKEKNMFKLIFSKNHKDIGENVDNKNILVIDYFLNVVYSQKNTHEVKKIYGENTL